MGQTASMCPAQSTGVLSKHLEMPPKPNEMQQSGNIPNISLKHSKERIIVETDAVPSPARTTETVEASEESDLKEQTKPNSNFPTTSPPKSEIPRNQTDQNESRQRSASSTRGRQHKNNRNSGTKSGGPVQINIQSCTGVHIGPVKNIQVQQFHSHYTQSEENMDKRKKRMKCYKKLLSCEDEIHEWDIVIVSETLEETGLEFLMRKLPMDLEELVEVKRKFEKKGHTEIIVQLLKYWKSQMPEEAKLGLFSDLLLDKELYKNGGKKALIGLLKNFPVNHPHPQGSG